MRRQPYLSEIAGASSSASKPVLICFSHLRWNFVYQRPQHILSRAASDYKVYIWEEPVFNGSQIPQLENHITKEAVEVVVPVLPSGLSEVDCVHHQRELLDELLNRIGPEPISAWYYTPYALTFSAHLSPHLTVYDNMDELSAFVGAPPELVDLEGDLLARADVVFTGGQSIYEAKRHRHRNIHAFPSSIDVAHFAEARKIAQPLFAYLEMPRPRLGFFGVIDERLNLELVAELADRRPEWQLVMIGPVAKIDPSSLPRRQNLHWLGPKSYSDLPIHLAQWDLGIMPFAENEATRFISPTKTPEFLAAGKPVISTPIRDVVRPYGRKGLVAIASNADGFIAEAESILRRPKEFWLARVDQHLSAMSWDRTWSEMKQLIKHACSERRVGHAELHDGWREDTHV